MLLKHKSVTMAVLACEKLIDVASLTQPSRATIIVRKWLPNMMKMAGLLVSAHVGRY